jgi:hypothetical protein
VVSASTHRHGCQLSACLYDFAIDVYTVGNTVGKNLVWELGTQKGSSCAHLNLSTPMSRLCAQSRGTAFCGIACMCVYGFEVDLYIVGL